MDNMLMNENESVKYQVRLGGEVLTEAQSRPMAEQFVMSLTKEQREKATIVPITEGGKQILLG